MSTTRAPSICTLCQLKDVTPETARKIRTVIKFATREELEDYAERYLPRARNWLMRCYHRPSRSNLRANMLDELLGTHGVEYIFRTSEGLAGHCNSESDDLICTYLNAGDPYISTLIRVYPRRGYRAYWRIGCWGTLAEREV
jgi:hypothetical protein